MSGALHSDMGGMLTEPVEAPRGLTNTEVDTFLLTGELPDLGEPSADVDVDDNDDDDDSPPIMSPGDARLFLAGITSVFVAAGGYAAVSPALLHGVSQISDVFKFNPGQPRDHDGKWTDTGLGALPKLDVSSMTSPKFDQKSITPAVIYKKHTDGAVVAVSADGTERLRWDASRKKYVSERRGTGGDWQETAQLTKTVAYDETKQPDRWFKPNIDTAPQPASTVGAPGRVTKITATDVESLLTEVTGTDDRDEYMRRALDGLTDFGPDVASTYISRDESGKLTGVMTIVDHVVDAEEQSVSPYSTIDYIGARGDGAGRTLIKQAVEHALNTNTTIMAEPTAQSLPFWERLGFHPDPLGEGVDLYGLTYDEATNWPGIDQNARLYPVNAPTVQNVEPSSASPEPELPPAVVEPQAKTTGLVPPADLRTNPAILNVLDDPGAFKASHGGVGVPSDIILEAIAERRGFTDRPQTGTKDDVDAAIVAGQPELLKAFQEETHLANFTDGPYYAGVGDQGNGIYASYRPPGYDVIAEIRREEYGPGPKGVPITDEQIVKVFGEDELKRLPELYERRRAEVEGRLLAITKTYGQHVLRGSLHSDVDVKSLKDDVYPAQRAYLSELTAELNTITDPVENDRASRWIEAMRDPGRFAAASGVRAYYGTTPGEIVVLDRGALIVQRDTDTANAPLEPELPPAVVEPPVELGEFDQRYEGPRFELPEDVDQSAVDGFRAAMATELYETRLVETRAEKLRTENPEMFPGYLSYGKSQELAREQLRAEGLLTEVQSDDALTALHNAMSHIKSYDVRESIRRRLHYEASVEGHLTVFAERHELGALTPKLKRELSKKIKSEFAGKKIAMRVTPKNLEHILRDGRIKSQFETGKSKGMNDQQGRASYEQIMFGIDPSITKNVEKRPIYGYVAVDGVRPVAYHEGTLGGIGTDALSQYGQVQVVFKDEIRDRSTAVYGDSLNHMAFGLPSPVNQPSWLSLTPMNHRSMITGNLDQLERDPRDLRLRSQIYVEAQIHDGVSTGDIAEVVFPNKPTAVVQKLLEERGIPWRVLTLKSGVAAGGELGETSRLYAQQQRDYALERITPLEERIANYQAEGKMPGYYEDTTKDLQRLQKLLNEANQALAVK